MIILRRKNFSRLSSILTTLGRGKNRLETLGTNASIKLSDGFKRLVGGRNYQPTSIVNYAVPKSYNQINSTVNSNLSSIKDGISTVKTKVSDIITNPMPKVNRTILDTSKSLNKSIGYIKSHTPGQMANEAISFSLGHPVAAASPVVAAANIAFSPIALKALPVGTALTSVEAGGLGAIKPYAKFTKKLQSTYNNSKFPGIVEKGVDSMVNYFPK